MIRPASCQGVSRSWNAILDGQTANASILVATVLERRSHRAQKMGETTADEFPGLSLHRYLPLQRVWVMYLFQKVNNFLQELTELIFEKDTMK